MRFRYSEFNPDFLRELNMEKVMNLFLQLLMQSDGDVDQAMRWLEQLWKRHNFFGGEIGIDDFKEYLEREAVVAPSGAADGSRKLTEKGEARIRTAAFEEIFTALRPDELGGHRTSYAGSGGERLAETRPYEYGDEAQDIDFQSSMRNALLRVGERMEDVEERDFEVWQREQSVACATALLLDVSHSMILYGEDRFTPARKVALALTELIQTRYPKDSLDVILFGDDAEHVPIARLPYAAVGPFHTNTKAGLVLAQKLLMQKRNVNKQIFMITDGKPSCIWEGGRLYKNSFGLDPKIVSQTINEAVSCRRRGITITTFMITTDSYLQDFVDRLTVANKGRAYYAQLDNLGSFILADYVKNRKKRV